MLLFNNNNLLSRQTRLLSKVSTPSIIIRGVRGKFPKLQVPSGATKLLLLFLKMLKLLVVSNYYWIFYCINNIVPVAPVPTTSTPIPAPAPTPLLLLRHLFFGCM